MRRLLSYFVRGLVLTVPIAVTAWACLTIFVTVDSWLGTLITAWLGHPLPGAGFALTITLVTLIGLLGSTIITRSLLAVFEGLLERLPLVRLLYSATKDLLNALVGEKRRFDQPVSISLVAGSGIQMFGFVTQESLGHLGLDGLVSVYCPHSYAWAGQMLAVPTSQVHKLHHASSDVMAFIVSGGVTGFPTPASTPARAHSAVGAIPSQPEPQA
jgi:uncharacterized membrane protein